MICRWKLQHSLYLVEQKLCVFGVLTEPVHREHESLAQPRISSVLHFYQLSCLTTGS